jgi:hypothetical protein
LKTFFDKDTYNPPLLTQKEEETITDAVEIDKLIVTKFYDWCLDYSYNKFDNAKYEFTCC